MKLRTTAVSALFFYGILTVTYASSGNFYVAAPKVLRLNAEETVVIAMDGTETGALVEVTVQDHPKKLKTIVSKTVQLSADKPKVFPIVLEPTDFPEGFFETPVQPKYVSLTAKFFDFSREIVIPVTSHSGYLFIQTDKPIYAPNQMVTFHITSVSEEIRRSGEPFQILIKNPNNTIVQKKMFPGNNVFQSYIHTLPQTALLGEWEAVAQYGHKMQESSTVHFTVKEYVVPTFKVELKTPDVILPNTDKFNISVNAKSVYGRNLQGVVHFRLGVRKPNSPTADIFGEVAGRELIKGDCNLEVRTEDVRKVGWFPQIEGSRLFLEATVVDAATGNTQTVSDLAVRFSATPFVISFDRSLEDFKPGRPSVFEVYITYVGGKPAKDIKTKVRAVASNGKVFDIVQDTIVSDSDGKVTFEILTETPHTSVTATLETIDERFVGNQAEGSFVQVSYKATNNASLAILRSSPQRLRPDDIFSKRIHFEPPGTKHIYYMVIARGKILIVGKLPQGQYAAQGIQFKITHNMVPSFRVLTFAHLGGELMVDSLKFDVENLCHPSATVEIEPEYTVKEPGHNGKIIINGKKDTTVRLLCVDEAAYALSRGNLLTKEKLFDTLGSHDLGCGPGGGLTVDSALGNAGITMGTNLYTPKQFHSCVEKNRKKRDVSQAEIDFEHPKDVVPHLFRLSFEEQKKKLKDQGVRSDFREIMLLQEKMIGLDDRAEVPASLPHRITTWVVQAVSWSPEGGMCVAEPKKVESFQKIFLQLNLPYSVVRNEQVEIQATVYNYDQNEIYVNVSMEGSPGLCSEAAQDENNGTVTVRVDAESAATVTFRTIPMEVGTHHIKVYVVSRKGSDVIDRKLNVVPEGITKEIDISIKLDPTNVQGRQSTVIENELYHDIIDPSRSLQFTAIKLALPEGIVPDTVSCYITAVGDTFGLAVDTSIKNPENLMKLPYKASGETNMVILAPTVYAMNYLNAIGKLTAAVRETGSEYIRKGYDNQKEFQKDDGSYSNYDNSKSSIWLTAVATKVFCQASKFASIDRKVTCRGIDWLIKNQEADGSYIEKTELTNKYKLGASTYRVPLTAFVLITLSECGCNDTELTRAKEKAIDYLEKQLDDVKYPGSTSILAYALSLSNRNKKEAAIQKLFQFANYDKSSNQLHWQMDTSSNEIITAGYALMTLLKLSKDMSKCSSIVNWLNSKQLQSGAFKSTQDTVVALEALSKYAIAVKSTANLVTLITSSNDKNWDKVLELNEDNALVLQSFKIDRIDGTIFIKTEGQGQGILTAKLRYNLLVPIEDICKFNVTVDATEILDFVPVGDAKPGGTDPQNDAIKKKHAFNIAVCVRYLGRDKPGMTIVDVGTFSGFEPYIRDLKKLQDDEKHLIKSYETSDRGVVFYLEKVPTAESYCFNYHVIRKFYIGNTQMRAIRVYDYHNPDESCSKFYNVSKENPMLSIICDEGRDCECAEGGCPEEEPFAKYKDPNAGKTRDALITAFCDNFDFVWKGSVTKLTRPGNGFRNITFRIEEVVKEGREKKLDILGKTRTLLMKDNCDSSIFVQYKYLIAGKDGKSFLNARGKAWYRYKLDKESAVHLYLKDSRASEDEKLERSLKGAITTLSADGCNQ